LSDLTIEYRHCVIGPGRLGSALLAALYARGMDVACVGVSVLARTDAEADPPRLLVPQAIAAAAGGPAPLAIWLTVPDDAIGPVALQIARSLPPEAAQSRPIVAVHTSGLGSLELLRPLAAAGVRTVALHPLQSFAPGSGAGTLADVPIAVTAADTDGLAVGRHLAEAIGGRPFDLPDAARPRYHLAAVVASNLLVALQAEAAGLLREAAGGEVPDAVERLRPLVTTTLANVQANGPERALTGPVARGDVGTVRRHLEILDDHEPRYAAAYRALSLEALALAAPRLDDETVAALHELLGPFPGQAGAAPAGPRTAGAPRGEMIVVRTVAEMRAVCSRLPRLLGFVPTMGALHAGHLELVRQAGRDCAAVVASIFVNPTQFGAGEDFATYPRDEARDLDLLRAVGVAAVFAPAPGDVYAEGFTTTVHVAGPLTEGFEGAHRPGHFDGVTTVVTKLLGAVGPDVLFLGRKDAQQLAVLRRAVRDLDLPVSVAGVATVREPDGLAMSSRNQRLSATERRVAPRLYAALLAGRAVPGVAGTAAAGDVIAAVRAGLEPVSADEPGFTVDYIAVVDPETFQPLSRAAATALIVAAVRLGGVRLLDNLPMTEEDPLDHHQTGRSAGRER
jgi:pantoate--beta-alanine ligase